MRTFHIETEGGKSYDVEVDDTAQPEPQGPPPEVTMAQKARIGGMMAQEAFKLTPMGRFASDPVKNTMENLPLIGAVGGSMVAPGAGTAAGAGLGQIGKRMYGISQGAPGPEETNFAPGEMIMPMVQTALAGVPEVGGVKAAVQKTAQGLAAIGLGIKGALLKRVGLDKAREVGQTMMDEGVIKGTSLGTEATKLRAEDAAASSGKAIGEGLSSLDEAGVRSFNPRVLARKVYEKLRPGRLGGAYNEQELAAREVRDTVLAHREGGKPITFDSAQELKETLQKQGKFHSLNAPMKAQMYREASGVIKQAMEDAVGRAAGKEVVMEGGPPMGTEMLPKGDKVIGTVGNIAPDVLENYQKAKKVYGAAETSIEGLTGKLNAEASSGPSLRGTIIAAGAASQGHLTPALEALGAWEVGSRYGARAGAASMNFLNNSVIAENVRRAVTSHFISRIRMKGQD